MDQQVAETIARATREEAELQARDDLDQLRRRAVDAGRERSRKIIKITTIDTGTGAIGYNPAGRLLRDWYLHVYINSLRDNLNQPNEAIDTQQVEDAAAILRRLRPNDESPQALREVEASRMIAVTDAATAAARITERLHQAGTLRAIRHAPDQRFDGDPLRVHVTRHWYQRCYDNTLQEAVPDRHPLAAVTDAELIQVATTLATRRARRLIGDDGHPLMTAYRDRPHIEEPAAEAARKMFNHSSKLSAPQITADPEDDLARLDLAEQPARSQAMPSDALQLSDQETATRRLR